MDPLRLRGVVYTDYDFMNSYLSETRGWCVVRDLYHVSLIPGEVTVRVERQGKILQVGLTSSSTFTRKDPLNHDLRFSHGARLFMGQELRSRTRGDFEVTHSLPSPVLYSQGQETWISREEAVSSPGSQTLGHTGILGFLFVSIYGRHLSFGSLLRDPNTTNLQ